MEQIKKTTSYNSKSIYYLFNFFTAIMFCSAVLMILALAYNGSFSLAILYFALVLSIVVLFGIVTRKHLLYTNVLDAEIVSKCYCFNACTIKWENVKCVAEFWGISDRHFGNFIWSKYIILSSDIINVKCCNIFTYKTSTQIAIRVGLDNADELLPIINQKLGLSIELGVPDKTECHIFEIKSE